MSPRLTDSPKHRVHHNAPGVDQPAAHQDPPARPVIVGDLHCLVGGRSPVDVSAVPVYGDTRAVFYIWGMTRQI